MTVYWEMDVNGRERGLAFSKDCLPGMVWLIVPGLHSINWATRLILLFFRMGS